MRSIPIALAMVAGCVDATESPLDDLSQSVSQAPLVYHGGHVIQKPQVVPVLYGTGLYLPQIASSAPGSLVAFYRQAVASGVYDWLAEYTTTFPYQPLIARNTVERTLQIFPPRRDNPIADATIQNDLVANISAGVLPAPTDNTIYMVHMPAAAVVQDGGTTVCAPPPTPGECGYHRSFTSNGKTIFYAVIPGMNGGFCTQECATKVGLSPWDATQSVASHELVEAITDPVLGTGWTEGPPTGPEIGDKCSVTGSFVGTDGATYRVQQMFSNQENNLPTASSPCIATTAAEGTGPVETWGAAFWGNLATVYADVTGDGRADAIAVDASTITVQRSNGTTFNPTETWSQTPFWGSQQGTFFADVDGDGRADAIAVYPSGIAVRKSTGSGFAPSTAFSTVPYFGSVATIFADVDGDHRADAIAVNGSNIVVRRSNGATFGPNENWTTNPYFGNVATAFADVDGDGRVDAIAVNTTNIVVRRSTGTLFGANETWTTTPFFGNVATRFADVDGDGRADAIAINTSGTTVRRSVAIPVGVIAARFFGNNEAWTLAPFTGNLASTFADVTGDGKADAIAVSISGSGVTVRRSLRSRAP